MLTNRERAITAIRSGVSLRDALPCANHTKDCACLLCEWVPVIEEAQSLNPTEILLSISACLERIERHLNDNADAELARHFGVPPMARRSPIQPEVPWERK